MSLAITQLDARPTTDFADDVCAAVSRAALSCRQGAIRRLLRSAVGTMAISKESCRRRFTLQAAERRHEAAQASRLLMPRVF